MSMSLAIVIPAKNEARFLPRLLHSVRRQTLQPNEVIVADAGSSDGTREIAERFKAKVVEGGMPGAGRNRGAAATQADLIFFLDADVELKDRQFLEKALKDFNDQDLDIATADVEPIGGTKYDRFSHKIYNTYVRLLGRLHPHTPGFCILVRRRLHEKIGGFDERVVLLEDHDYAVRANKVGNFGFLSNVKIMVSIRRQERDGRFSMGLKYILAELHMWTIGSIRHNKFKYTFGYDQENHKPAEITK